MKDKTEEIKRMEYAIKSFANAAIHATKMINEFGNALNQIEVIKKEQRRKLKQRRIEWIKYYLLFGWTKSIKLFK